MNTALWERYREQIQHPTTIVKVEDLDVAHTNMERHTWARKFAENLLDHVERVPPITVDFLERMIPRETPGSALFTMCPVCETAPVHGHYAWSSEDPDRLVCTTCKTVYPNPDYPEDLVIETDFGGGQRITFYGGKHWPLLNFPFRSSWTANIRARKCSYMARVARELALAYVLTGDVGFAAKVRDILLRFAEVYPGYMVHSGYGEFSDLDPETASAKILDLPKPELVLPPNGPNRVLHAGYWMAGRATGVGMEGSFISQVTIAYDLVCEVRSSGQPLFLPEERLRIERDLLLEGTFLLCADPSLNNKSATNRSAAGLVGICLGDPDLVRFGLKGFQHFAREWFLRDGLTSESPSYGFMTLNGIRSFGDALHGYSDPNGYEGPDGRIDVLDIYGDSRYRAVFDGFFKSLMPDLTYPVVADSNTTTKMPVEVAETMVARYDDGRYRALLVEFCEGDLESHGKEYALFHRNPDLVADPSVSVDLPDVFFPDLRIGMLRTGAHGRESTVVVSASDWGGHHHEDSLNLIYWKDGHEALTDLGYLWDRPDKAMTVRTMAHNTVMVDGQSQKREGRGGSLHCFDVTPRVKIVEVSSQAYDAADIYRRLCAVINHGKAGSYLVDVFRVRGGGLHDYLFHGPTEQGMVRDLALKGAQGDWQDLKNVMEGTSDAPWSIAFELDGERRFVAYSLPDGPGRVLIGDGWGERGTGVRDKIMTGETVPYVVRQRSGDPAQSTFISLFDVGSSSESLVRGVERLMPCQGEGVGIRVTTQQGTDVIAFCFKGHTATFETPEGTLSTNGLSCAISIAPDGGLNFGYLAGGTRVSLNGHVVEMGEDILQGKILEDYTDNTVSYYVIDRSELDRNMIGRTLLVAGGAYSIGFPIAEVEAETHRLYIKTDGLGYDAMEAQTWKIIQSVCE